MLCKKIPTLWSALLFSYSLCAPTVRPDGATRDDHRNFIKKEKSSIPCQKSSGDDLQECLFSQTICDQRKVFSQLSPEQRKEFLKFLTLERYDKFLDAFSEKEWQELLKELPEGKQYPKTVKSQKNSIQTIKDDAQTVRDIFFFWSLGVDVVFPPAMFAHILELGYIVAYDIHPVVQEERRKRFKKYLKETFNVIQE